MPPFADTRTGYFPIGFRRRGDWQRDTDRLIAWAAANSFASIDLIGGDSLV